MTDTPHVERARARSARPSSAALHLVAVFPSTGPSVMALCGRHPTGGWVLRPAWPERLCASCERRDRLDAERRAARGDDPTASAPTIAPELRRPGKRGGAARRPASRAATRGE